MSRDKLVRMANQIATFFQSQPGDAAEKVAEHINAFWEPRMRRQLIDIIAAGGEGLCAPVVAAADRIRPPQEAAEGADRLRS